MTRLLQWLVRYRPLTVTLALLAVWGVFEIWSELGGQRKLTDAELAGSGARVNVAIELNFAPEVFHITRLQDAGRLIEIDGPTAFMMDVPADSARQIASKYWVRDVQLWEGR